MVVDEFAPIMASHLEREFCDRGLALSTATGIRSINGIPVANEEVLGD